MDFKNVDKKYRPVPFWSWNEKLSPEETRRQTAILDESGHGGFFMHARGGLQTEYMGEEWFENVSAAVDESNKRGMHAWAYDENGWPSGFGGGKVNGKGEKYWQKYLRIRPAGADMSDIEPHRIITRNEKYIFYYDVNPFYVIHSTGRSSLTSLTRFTARITKSTAIHLTVSLPTSHRSRVTVFRGALLCLTNTARLTERSLSSRFRLSSFPRATLRT